MIHPYFIEYDRAKIDANSKIIRNMIEHENNLVAQRVSWMATIEGLLFAALTFAWKDDSARELIPALCFFGFIVALVTIINICFAIKATTRLICWYQKHNDNKVITQLPPVIGLDIYPNDDGYYKYVSPSTVLVSVFLFGWLWIYHVSP